MNPVMAHSHRSLPATSVLKLAPHKPAGSTDRSQRAAETLLAAVKFPPRAAEARPLGDLLPEVLAAYGVLYAERGEVRHAAGIKVPAMASG